jgi:hypothetical protein
VAFFCDGVGAPVGLNNGLGVNGAGAPVAFGRAEPDKLYCGRYLGAANILGSDGYCGTSNGPQCADCQLVQDIQSAVGTNQPTASKNRAGARVCWGADVSCKHILYCGRDLGRSAIPGSDGQCGPSNGPQCADCKALTGQHSRVVATHAGTSTLLVVHTYCTVLKGGGDTRQVHLLYCIGTVVQYIRTVHVCRTD